MIKKENGVKPSKNCCGECCWFKFELTSGDGTCVKDWPDGLPNCGDTCKNGQFVSVTEMRHHMAVLLQYRRWRNSPVGVNIHRPFLDDIDKALAFASDYMKTFSKF